MNDQQQFAPLPRGNTSQDFQDELDLDDLTKPHAVALRNYMHSLVSDCAETNETSFSKMCVTIVSDNTMASLRRSTPDSTEESPTPNEEPIVSKGTPGDLMFTRLRNRRCLGGHPEFPTIQSKDNTTPTEQ